MQPQPFAPHPFPTSSSHTMNRNNAPNQMPSAGVLCYVDAFTLSDQHQPIPSRASLGIYIVNL
jgi:hypothetical protein